ncbi:MarR family winged helix-turn-helix transcriptional regulator [Agreia sp. PsM10]|uniref:MarR family winged helix-turn-helix transcriptional regulator n=1 Tax=Agreia sp. PsM10 TaxID=3030533 RepID=UPI00263AB8F4|nr:MarR family winged helix-turn-helix transcriptional regulator [Agreia sp. PsM10]MDN4639159.1 MarR family winged helix-turn-helix transcriptional regulator [Agreia sp. PsM10]
MKRITGTPSLGARALTAYRHSAHAVLSTNGWLTPRREDDDVGTYLTMFTQLVQTEIALWNALDERLAAETGHTLGQLQAVTAIASLDGPARVQDISAAMSITVGATSKLVDRLEASGLAVRAANPNDRRSSIVSLTEAGSRFLDTASAMAETHLADALGGILTNGREAALTDELSSLRSQVASA